jgi:uncharacterized MnhB-related membrane protein
MMRSTTPATNHTALVLGTVTVIEAATFAIASTLHLGTHVPFTGLVGEHAPDAAGPEALIAGVLLVGAVFLLAKRRHAWGVALGTHSFAAAGTLVGISEVFSGRGPPATADYVYHVTIFLVLVAILAVLARARTRAALASPAAPPALLSPPSGRARPSP